VNCNHSCFSPTWSNTLSLHYFYFLRKRRSPSQLHLLITTTFHLYSFCPLISHQYNFITFFNLPHILISLSLLATMGRSPCCEKEHTNKGAWTKEEDERLINYIKLHGEGCWRSLPKAAGI